MCSARSPRPACTYKTSSDSDQFIDSLPQCGATSCAGLVAWLTSAATRALAAAAEGAGEGGVAQQGGGQRQLGLAVIALEALAGLCGAEESAGAMRA